jgi:beta-phosphoglucomutase family hydrolase
MIKALIFDMDGTIVDNMGVHTAVWLDILAGFGVTMTRLEFQAATAGMTNPELLRLLVDPDMADDTVATIARRKEARYREQYAPSLEPLPGLLALLRQARQAGMALAVATAANKGNIDFVMNGLQMWDYFDVIVGADDVVRGKPHPDLFLLAAEQLGVPPAHCLVFEDAMTGIEASRRAGMSVIGVATSHSAAELAAQPGVCQTISDFTQLQFSDLLA